MKRNSRARIRVNLEFFQYQRDGVIYTDFIRVYSCWKPLAI